MSGSTRVAAKPPAASYLGRLLDVLATVGQAEGITLSDLSRETGLSLSTAHRLTKLLIDREFVTRLNGSRLFTSGPQLERLGIHALRRLHEPERFEATVARLSAQTGESVSLGLIVANEVILVARKESAHPLRAVVRIGDVVPLDRSAMGKVILAHSSGRVRARLVSSIDAGYDALEQLEPELEQARRDGYARDEEVFSAGLRCVAAPFFDARGEPVGGVSIAGPVGRLTSDLVLKFAPLLLEAVEELSHELGHAD